jgi:radical SAM protein with 4Fe4S-binding SPASM domain
LTGEEILGAFRRIAESCDPRRVRVAISGGEPLVRPDIFPLLARISELGYPIGMVTSGFPVGEKTPALLAAAGVRTVSVSLDGLEATHNWVRGHDEAFARASRALVLLKQSGFFQVVEAITTVNRRNLPELPAIAGLCASLGIDAWRLFATFPIGRALEDAELRLDGAALRGMLDFIKEYRKAGPPLRVSYCEDGCFGPEHELAVRDFVGPRCLAGTGMLAILADGSLTGCLAADHGFIQGNLLSDDIVTVWRERFRVFRDRSWMKKTACAGCVAWKHCAGDGFHLWRPGTDGQPAARGDCAWELLAGKQGEDSI